MKAYVFKTVSGVFAFDERGNVILREEFPKDPQLIAEKMVKICEEEKKILERLEKMGYEILRDSSFRKRIKLKVDKELAREVAFVISKKKIEDKAKERDRIIIQAVEALDDINKTINLLKERMREWNALPLEFGPIEEEFNKKIKELEKFKGKLEEYIKSEMERVAPNLSSLVGAILGARLIAMSGGLKKLAELPASRIQLLGAEKALFRHIIKHTKPPKHGIIFQHPLVRNTPKKLRGKVARTFAAKIAIASRIDAFSGIDKSKELKKRLEERVKSIQR